MMTTTEPYRCEVCGKTFIPRRPDDVLFCIGPHPPGTCCHYRETEASPRWIDKPKPRLRWRHGADIRGGDIWTVRASSEPWHSCCTMAWNGETRYFNTDADLYNAFFA